MEETWNIFRINLKGRIWNIKIPESESYVDGVTQKCKFLEKISHSHLP